MDNRYNASEEALRAASENRRKHANAFLRQIC